MKKLKILRKKDTDVSEAKKKIRKGAERKYVQDSFGYEHGFDSDKAKELDSSRLVQRKYAKESKDMKNQPSFKKKAYKDFEGTSKWGKYGDSSEKFSKKESKKIIKLEKKNLRKEANQETKERKARAKATRIILRSKK